jgi:hypothetical protein
MREGKERSEIRKGMGEIQTWASEKLEALQN